MLDSKHISSAVRNYTPRLVSSDARRRAAVALLLREQRRGPEVLFIERARRMGDPWSGQMAFPGGGVDAADPSPRRAAERETREELGIRLDPTQFLGRIDDLEGRPRPIVVSCFVYHLNLPITLNPNAEVEQAFWVPVSVLLDRSRTVAFEHPDDSRQLYPGIQVGTHRRHTLLGLTHRFLSNFFQVLGGSLPRIGRTGSARSVPGQSEIDQFAIDQSANVQSANVE